MKKFKKLTFLVTALCMLIAMTVSNFGFAFAAGTTNLAAIDSASSQIPTEIVYGGNFILPTIDNAVVTYTVNKPNGESEDMAEGATVNAEYLGVYEIGVSINGGSFHKSFKVKVINKDEQLMEVSNNGADIPTYVATGATVTFPTAKIYTLNDDGEKEYLPTQPTITVVVTSPNGTDTTLASDYSYKFGTNGGADSQGSYYVRYSYKPANAKHVISKDYVIKAQDDFEDTVAPTLSVGTISSEYSVRTAVTLPTASATDNFDENIAIMVTVEDPDGNPVYKAEIEEKSDMDGTVYKFVKDYKTDKQEFRNYESSTMTFYPHKAGKYKVRYWAYDDAGNGLKAATGSKTEYTNAQTPVLYEFDVTDRQAPRFLFSKDDRASIPSVWSIALESAHGITGVNNGSALTMKFPLPLIVDNLDGSNEDYITYGATNTVKEDRKIKIDFNIKNPNSKTVFTVSDVYDSNSIFVKNNGEFKFGDTANIASADRITGDYTINYTVRDSANNIATKSFTVNLTSNTASEFTAARDKTNLSLTLSSVESYVKLDSTGEGMIKLPVYTAYDKKDSYVKTEVIYTFGTSTNGTDFTPAAPAITGDFDKDLYIYSGTGTTPKDYVNIGDNTHVKVTYKATNDYGNSVDYGITNSSEASIIRIVNPSNLNAVTMALATDTPDVVNGTTGEITSKPLTKSTIASTINATTYTQRELAKLGRFVFSVTGNDEFAGVQMIIRQPDSNILDDNGTGSVVNSTTATYYSWYNTSDSKTYVALDDISFTPGKSGTYSVTFVCTTLSNQFLIKTYYIVVAPSDEIGWELMANATIPGTFEMGETINLPRPVLKGETNGKEGVIGTTISGPLYDLSGSEFTPYATGTEYSFTVNYVRLAADKISANVVDLAGSNSLKYLDAKAESNDTVNPIINLVEPLQMYSAKYDGEKLLAEGGAELTGADYFNALEKMVVFLPEVAGYDINGVTKVEYEVTNKNGTIMEIIDYTYGGKAYKYFRPEIDGKYTVNVKISDNNNTASATFYVYAGDIISPKLTVEEDYSTKGTVKQGYTFKFDTVTATDNVSTGTSKISITKQVLDPNGTEVLSDSSYTSSVSVNLDKVGTYTIVYKATDEAGNVTRKEYTISVTATSSRTPVSMQTLSTVLIIAAVLLLVGVIIYFIRYRRVRVSA